MSRSVGFAAFVVLCVLGCGQDGAPTAGALEGAWRIIEMQLTGPDGHAVYSNPLPSL